jgi:hypothetical protein
LLRSCQSHSYSRISQHLCNPEVHYRVHKSPSLVLIVSQKNPVHTSPSCLCKLILILSYLRVGFPNGFFSTGFPAKMLYTLLFCPMCATYPAHVMLLHMIILIMYLVKSTSTHVHKSLNVISYFRNSCSELKINTCLSKL